MSLNPNRVLQKHEVLAVLKKLKANRWRCPPGRRLNLALFRLSCCCGLRSKELRGLLVSDLILTGPRPFINIRAANTKGYVKDGVYKADSRRVPLWWDTGTYGDLLAWHKFRTEQGGLPFFLVTQANNRGLATAGRPLKRNIASDRWRTCMKVLGAERQKQLSIHTGRASFISHSLHAGRSLAEVMLAVGHKNPATTAQYMHAIETDGLPDVFG